MVVDGVATNRILMKVRLSAACYNVVALASGNEATHALRHDLPEIILIGGSLPDMPAIELCRILRSLPGCRRIPILMQVAEGERLAALSAGATGIIDAKGDDLTLLARIRRLLRASGPDPENLPELAPLAPAAGLQETQTDFRGVTAPRLLFVTGQTAAAQGWRQALQSALDLRIPICEPERALVEAEAGQSPDLYLIAADIHQSGDGLRLLSELRSRSRSRHAAFVIVLRPERSDMTAVALDLGAGDVLSSTLSTPQMAAEAAMLVRAQLERKRLADRQRRETQRNLMWAMVDPLTGLHNRRYAMPNLADMLAQSCKSRRSLAIMLIDIDHFKQVNDRHGHGAGDAVLVGVAARLRDALPPEALLARIGGEEFLAAFPAATPAEACRIAESLRYTIAETPFDLPDLAGGTRLAATISAGLAFAHPRPQDVFSHLAETLIARADRALMTAKSEGRNRIIVAAQGLAA